MSPQTRKLSIPLVNRFHHIVRFGAELLRSAPNLFYRDGLVVTYNGTNTIDHRVKGRECNKLASKLRLIMEGAVLGLSVLTGQHAINKSATHLW